MIAIVDYGAGNLKSVKCAMDRLGQDAVVTSGAAEIACASGVILPGVGAFARAMDNLRESGLIDAMKNAAASGKPFMGICLGYQLLFSESDEHGKHEGLDIIKGSVRHFAVGLKVPQMGWNQVRQERQTPLLEGVADESFFYFAHSYFVDPTDQAVVIGSTDYGGRYASAIQEGNVYGLQFHPEKSAQSGLKILENFCNLAK